MKTKKESFWAEFYGAAFVGVLASPIAIVFLLPFLILQEYSGDSFKLAESWWLFVWAGTSAGVLIGRKFSEDDKKQES